MFPTQTYTQKSMMCGVFIVRSPNGQRYTEMLPQLASGIHGEYMKSPVS